MNALLTVCNILLFRFNINWSIGCSLQQFIETINNSMSTKSEKPLSGKPLFGEHNVENNYFKIFYVNSCFNSIFFNSKTIIIYKGENPVRVKLQIEDLTYFLVWGGIIIITLFIMPISIKNIILSVIIGYLICFGLFSIEVLLKWSVIHDVLLKTKSPVVRIKEN